MHRTIGLAISRDERGGSHPHAGVAPQRTVNVRSVCRSPPSRPRSAERMRIAAPRLATAAGLARRTTFPLLPRRIE